MVVIENFKTSINIKVTIAILDKVLRIFKFLCEAGARTIKPRRHDLRHTFSVNRLTSWYQENKEVQQVLPILSVYLGHTHLAHTSAYLTMTNQILAAANNKFEHYLFQDNHHEK